MTLQLNRPIVFIDLETTGLDRETDRIVQLGLCKLYEDGTREVKNRLLNPGIPIPAEATAIHGITDEMVKDEYAFTNIAKSLLSFLEGCDIAGFASNTFDIPILYNEFARAGIQFDYKKHNLIDVGNIFKIQEPRTLTAAVKFYCDREHTDAHDASADANATCEVFVAQMEKYAELPQSMEELALFSNFGNKILDLSGKFTYNAAGEVVFNFGKTKGQVAKNDPGLLEWMLFKASFPADTCRIAEEELKKSQSVFNS